MAKTIMPKGKTFQFDESKPISADNPFDAAAYLQLIEENRAEHAERMQGPIEPPEPPLTTEEKTEKAHSVAGGQECGLNGQAINWRYWVQQMPVISAAQAACLMSALEPDIFHRWLEPDANLVPADWPGQDDPTRNIVKARKIRRLAEAESMIETSPTEWVDWAKDRRINVHTGFLLAVRELPEVMEAARPAHPQTGDASCIAVNQQNADEPQMKPGSNSNEACRKWIAFMAKKLASEKSFTLYDSKASGDKGLVTVIREKADEPGRKYSRRNGKPLDEEFVRKSIPAGTTGGHRKNGRKRIAK